MGILRRRQPKAEADAKPTGIAKTVHERIEVTVEREWISMLVRSQSASTPPSSGVPEAASILPASKPKLIGAAPPEPKTQNKKQK